MVESALHPFDWETSRCTELQRAALTFKDGHFAFQDHDPGSIVNIRKVEVMPMP